MLRERFALAKQSAKHRLVKGELARSNSKEVRLEKEMKNYINPEIEVVEINTSDVLTTSPGTETPWYEENDGSWEISAKA